MAQPKKIKENTLPMRPNPFTGQDILNKINPTKGSYAEAFTDKLNEYKGLSPVEGVGKFMSEGSDALAQIGKDVVTPSPGYKAFLYGGGNPSALDRYIPESSTNKPSVLPVANAANTEQTTNTANTEQAVQKITPEVITPKSEIPGVQNSAGNVIALPAGASQSMQPFNVRNSSKQIPGNVNTLNVENGFGGKGMVQFADGRKLSDESMNRINNEMALNADQGFKDRMKEQVAIVDARYADKKARNEQRDAKNAEAQQNAMRQQYFDVLTAPPVEGDLVGLRNQRKQQANAATALGLLNQASNTRAEQQQARSINQKNEFDRNLQLNELAYGRQKDRAANESALENRNYERNKPALKAFKTIGADGLETTEYGAINKKTGQRIIPAPQSALDLLTKAKGTKEYESIKNQFLQKYGQLPEGM